MISPQTLFITFTDNLLPILLTSAGGFIIAKYLPVDSRTVGRLAFYLFMPVLVFNLLIHNQLTLAEVAQTIGLAFAVIILVGMVTFLLALSLRLERQLLVLVVVTAMFANSGNYGLPLVTFAFGKDAAAYASLYFVASTILFNTLGVFIASLGHLTMKQAFLGLAKIPMIYAVFLALALNFFQIRLSTPLERTITQLAGGAVPLMLVLLGIELSRVKWSHNFTALGLITGVRLLVGPLLAFGLTGLLGVEHLARQAIITEASLPVAVSNTVLASEYRLDSSFVTAVVFISTLLSPFTLTPLLVILGKMP